MKLKIAKYTAILSSLLFIFSIVTIIMNPDGGLALIYPLLWGGVSVSLFALSAGYLLFTKITDEIARWCLVVLIAILFSVPLIYFFGMFPG